MVQGVKEVGGYVLRVQKILLATLTAVLSVAALAQPMAKRAVVTAEPCYADGWADALQCYRIPVTGSQETASAELTVLVAPALNAGRREPLYMLAGGPGQAASDLVPLLNSLRKLNRERDIVFVDRRGAGRSAVFDCGFPGAPPSDLARFTALLADCYAQNPDRPKTLNSRQAVRDLEQVRHALGHRKISLWGGSWGTRTALLYQQWQPQALQSLVLDGVAPIETKVFLSAQAAEAALQQLQQDCAEDATCAEFGDWRSELDRLLVNWDDQRARNFPDPITGGPVQEPIEAWMLANAVRAALYNPRAAAQLPFAIHQASNGNFLPLAGIVGMFSQMEGGMAMGLTFSVACAEELHRISAREISADIADTFLGDAFLRPFIAGCKTWSVPPLAYAPSEPRAHPVLLISGSADPITPPQYAEQQLDYQENRQHLIVQGGGHINSARGCIPELILEFLNGRGAALDAGCVADIRRPPFMAAAYGPALFAPALAGGLEAPDTTSAPVTNKPEGGEQ